MKRGRDRKRKEQCYTDEDQKKETEEDIDGAEKRKRSKVRASLHL